MAEATSGQGRPGNPEWVYEFLDVLVEAMGRVLRDLAVGWPEEHHREWILTHLLYFIHDEATARELHPTLLRNLEVFHAKLVERAEPVEPPIC